MDRKAFIQTIIDTLEYGKRYENIKDRENLIKLLGRTEANFVPKYAFANNGRPFQHKENIELRVPAPLLDIADSHLDELTTLVNYTYEESDQYALGNVEIKPLVTDTPIEKSEHGVVFDKIQDTVIKGIRDAKFIIWAAVAWFTNTAIFNELLIKKKNGLNIRIIVSGDRSNDTMINKLKENQFDIKVIPKWGNIGHNMVHDKFCIIDLDYVMHGSYNWTQSANYNEETLETALDRELVTKFANQFMKLYTIDDTF